MIGSSSMWGIESDSGAAFLLRLEDDLINEADTDIDYLRKSLNQNAKQKVA